MFNSKYHQFIVTIILIWMHKIIEMWWLILQHEWNIIVNCTIFHFDAFVGLLYRANIHLFLPQKKIRIYWQILHITKTVFYFCTKHPQIYDFNLTNNFFLISNYPYRFFMKPKKYYGTLSPGITSIITLFGNVSSIWGCNRWKFVISKYFHHLSL